MGLRLTSIHGEWSSRFAFIMAATGSAVGLGNIWRFPYITGENGGGAFVLVYLLCVALIGVPIMMAEIMLGRRGRQTPVNTMRTLAEEAGRSPIWEGVGWLGMLAGFLILSFYSVVGGWTLAYVVRTGTGVFNGATAQGVRSIFATFTEDPERLLAWHTIFVAMTVIVVSRGVRSGLEQAVRFLMPGLFLLLLVLVGYGMGTSKFNAAVHYLFNPDFQRLTPKAVLDAMGQAFFTLSLSMGAIMIYGSYLSHKASIARMTIIVACVDTLVAMLAGLAIFPVVFGYDLPVQKGTGLIFTTLPVAFGEMPGGAFFGMLFFLLLVFAAWTSAISLLEPIVTWLVENQGMNRVRASAWAGIVAWALGVACLLSLNVWARYTLFGKNFFGLMDFLTANIMLPLGGLLIAVFAAWIMPRQASSDELGMGDGLRYRLWRALVRYVAPVAIVLVFLNVTGILNFILDLLGRRG